MKYCMACANTDSPLFLSPSLSRLPCSISSLRTQKFLAPVIKHPAAQQVLVSFLTDSSKYVPSEGGREGGRQEGGVDGMLNSCLF